MAQDAPRDTRAIVFGVLRRVTPRPLRLRLGFNRRARGRVDPRFLRRAYRIGAGWSDRRLTRWYLRNVRTLGLSPSAKFDEDFYLTNNPDVKRAVVGGGYYCGFDHYLRKGKAEGRPGASRAALAGTLQSLFDAGWYRNTYADILAAEDVEPGDEFQHYLKKGRHASLSPNDWFDELWYRAAYPDVVEAIESRRLLTGFEHYVTSGRFEKREPAYDRKVYLEMKMPGVTRPAGIQNLKGLERKLEPVDITPDRQVTSARRLNFLVPTLDPAIIFGGYTTLIELANRLHGEGLERRIVICDDERFDLEWAKRRAGASPLHRLLSECEVVSIADNESLPVYEGDRFLCYSGWLALKAAPLAAATGFPRFGFLVQEYEPIFHSRSSLRMILDTAYATPHLPIFNTEELVSFFRSERLGIFAREDPGDYLVFQHALTPVVTPTVADLAARTEKRLLCYARPEPHAERNLFEVMVIALRRAIEAGAFTGNWSFHGVGSLTPGHSVKLSSDHTMDISPKLPLGDYGRALPTFDLGISLMYAPHPSLLPFEMAQAGMIVVTNTYSNRPAKHLRSISGNIEPAPLDVDGITQAIIRAVARVDDHEQRVANASLTWSTSWDRTFDEAFVKSLMSSLDLT